MPQPVWKHLDEAEEYRALSRVRLAHAVAVREPLVLISQIQRSGGTLLSQLLDGHPECHAHPHELKIGHPRKWTWPELDLARPKGWFNVLREKSARAHMQEGYGKENVADEVFPFVFSPRLQESIFEACVAARTIERERDVLDCYFTSYFNAWLDNHNLYNGPKRVVTGFTARLAMELPNVERFFEAYPDGTLISIVRDPRGWFASARTYASTRPGQSRYADLDDALGWWRVSAEATLAAAERFGEGVLVLTYEQLVGETEATMSRVADTLGITMPPALLTPTFNGRPIMANSSFAIGGGHGVRAERSGAYRDLLDRGEIARIDELAGDLYERAAGRSAEARGSAASPH
jgi:hypothetical protein